MLNLFAKYCHVWSTCEFDEGASLSCDEDKLWHKWTYSKFQKLEEKKT